MNREIACVRKYCLGDRLIFTVGNFVNGGIAFKTVILLSELISMLNYETGVSESHTWQRL